jgi:hypothetical protein
MRLSSRVVEAYEAIRDPAGLFVVDEDALTTGDAQLGVLRPGFTKPKRGADHDSRV